jgi:hypothetical protein
MLEKHAPLAYLELAQIPEFFSVDYEPEFIHFTLFAICYLILDLLSVDIVKLTS